MNDFVLSDDELIYYIKQDKQEAFELLFFRYEKNMKSILEKIENYLYMNLDEDLIWSLYYESFCKALKIYDHNKGVFYYFLKEVFRYALVRFYRNEMTYYDKEVLAYEDEEGRIPDVPDLESSTPYDNVDANIILDMIKSFGEEEYQLVTLWMQGYKYQEISEIMGITPKQTYYRLDKIFKKVKENLPKQK